MLFTVNYPLFIITSIALLEKKIISEYCMVLTEFSYRGKPKYDVYFLK